MRRICIGVARFLFRLLLIAPMVFLRFGDTKCGSLAVAGNKAILSQAVRFTQNRPPYGRAGTITGAFRVALLPTIWNVNDFGGTAHSSLLVSGSSCVGYAEELRDVANRRLRCITRRAAHATDSPPFQISSRSLKCPPRRPPSSSRSCSYWCRRSRSSPAWSCW